MTNPAYQDQSRRNRPDSRMHSTARPMMVPIAAVSRTPEHPHRLDGKQQHQRFDRKGCGSDSAYRGGRIAQAGRFAAER